jgi:hypothetical protein
VLAILNLFLRYIKLEQMSILQTMEPRCVIRESSYKQVSEKWENKHRDAGLESKVSSLRPRIYVNIHSDIFRSVEVYKRFDVHMYIF